MKFLTRHAGVCVRCMHIDSYDKEPETIRLMELYAKENGYVPDFSGGRFHQEIYLSTPRKVAEEKQCA